jgi:hypothetical protein
MSFILHQTTFNTEPRITRWIFWSLICVGICLPWCVGRWVKLYLNAIGQSTLPWSYFLSPGSIILEVPLTIWVASPYITFSILAQYVLSTNSFSFILYWERALIIILGALGGALEMINLFLEVFWVFDPLNVLVIVVIPILYTIHIFIGFLIGCGIISISVLLRKRVTREQV